MFFAPIIAIIFRVKVIINVSKNRFSFFRNHSTSKNDFVERSSFVFLMFFDLSRLKSVSNVLSGGIFPTYLLAFWYLLATCLGPNSGILFRLFNNLSPLRSISKSHTALPFCVCWTNTAASTNGSSSESVVA